MGGEGGERKEPEQGERRAKKQRDKEIKQMNFYGKMVITHKLGQKRQFSDKKITMGINTRDEQLEDTNIRGCPKSGSSPNFL